MYHVAQLTSKAGNCGIIVLPLGVHAFHPVLVTRSLSLGLFACTTLGLGD
jgi:hypothetical protein